MAQLLGWNIGNKRRTMDRSRTDHRGPIFDFKEEIGKHTEPYIAWIKVSRNITQEVKAIHPDET